MLVLEVSPTHWAISCGFFRSLGTGKCVYGQLRRGWGTGCDLRLSSGFLEGGQGSKMEPSWGVRAKQAMITERHRKLRHRGWQSRGAVSPPTPQTPGTAGMMPRAFEWTLCFTLAKQHNFKRQSNKSFLHLAPSSSPLSHLPPSLGWGISVLWWSLALASLQLQQPTAVVWLLQNQPGGVRAQPGQKKPLCRAWIMKIPASLKASGIWAPKHFLSHRMPPGKGTDPHLLMTFIITQSPWAGTGQQRAFKFTKLPTKPHVFFWVTSTGPCFFQPFQSSMFPLQSRKGTSILSFPRGHLTASWREWRDDKEF